MDAILATVGTAAGLFAGTNVDDIVVLALLNVSARADRRPARWQIWTGQYAGTAVLLVISLVAALGLTLVPSGWIWVLGFIPLSLGAGKLIAAIRARRAGQEVPLAVASGQAGVIGLTVANGGDNIAVYTPVFRTLGTGDITITCIVFAAGVALWCLAGSWLVSHHRITQVIQAWGHWITPAVFILIGLYVFYKGRAFGL
jgi:cadmium resistance protein CadD (predicted permease)